MAKNYVKKKNLFYSPLVSDSTYI